MSISPNSWSPDKKYVFLQENRSGSIYDVLVFKTSGEPFLVTEQYVSVAPLFTNRKTEYYLTDVTGWDSPTLLHMVTAVDASKKGPPYWFDVTSQSFIQLESR